MHSSDELQWPGLSSLQDLQSNTIIPPVMSQPDYDAKLEFNVKMELILIDNPLSLPSLATIQDQSLQKTGLWLRKWYQVWAWQAVQRPWQLRCHVIEKDTFHKGKVLCSLAHLCCFQSDIVIMQLWNFITD